MSSPSGRTVASLVKALDARFPFAWAADWDNVGLTIGDADGEVTGVLVTLDATAEAVARAKRAGANVVLTHHPPFLSAPEHPIAGPGPDGTLEAALREGVAVVSLHTNLDRSPEGSAALARLLGFEVGPAVESAPERIVAVVTYAPPEYAERIRHAMSAAGAGRIGEYAECAFVSPGTGRFTALEEARPALPDEGEGVAEVRIEMIAPPTSARAVLEAVLAVHPYEEPVVLALEGERARGVAALGRVCTWREGATLSDLAAHASATLGNACRVWGAPQRPAGRIAIGNGSAGSLVSNASRVADTLLAGEVRYHDALAANAAGLAVIECGHDSTEWPLAEVLGQAVRAWDARVPLVVEDRAIGWWTMEAPDVRG